MGFVKIQLLRIFGHDALLPLVISDAAHQAISDHLVEAGVVSEGTVFGYALEFCYVRSN